MSKAVNRFLKLGLCGVFCLHSIVASAYEYDSLVNSTFANKELTKPECNLNFNYQNTTKVPVKLQIITPVKSEKDLYEGQILEFRVKENVRYKNKIIAKRDDVVKAKIETLIANGMNGIPASIILGHFEIAGLKQSQITTNYEKYGLDLSLLVFPIKWALTPFPPTGSLTNFIKGGHAKIKQNDTITIYYHPEWI